MAERNELSAFLQLFADRHQTYVRSKSSTTWRATSQWHYLSDEELLSSLSADSSVRRAFGVLEKGKFLVIQIDGTKSPTAFQTTKNLQKQLRDTGLQPKTFYIDELELWQIFVFFAESVATQTAVKVAATWLENNWFDVDSEAVSILPSGAPLQIPLQASFNWLNDDLVRVVAASEMSFQNAVSMFMQDLRTNAVAYETFENALLQVPAIQSIKDEVPETLIYFTPLETSVQTVETDEQMDFSPIETPTSAVEKSERFSSDLETEKFVQTQDNDFETALLQLVQTQDDILEIEQEQEFQAIVHDDQLVQSDQTSDYFDPVCIDPNALISTEQIDSEPEDCEKKLFARHKDVTEGTLAPQIVEPQSTEVIAENLDPAAGKGLSTEPLSLESQADAEESMVQTLLFMQEGANERPPPRLENTDLKKSQLRKSSSRDGPGKKKKEVSASKNPDTDWDSYEQLTLPFGTNTS